MDMVGWVQRTRRRRFSASLTGSRGIFFQAVQVGAEGRGTKKKEREGSKIFGRTMGAAATKMNGGETVSETRRRSFGTRHDVATSSERLGSDRRG
jgi:hypothetical protein